jgi:beta-glucanase (GH16 family)
MRHTFAAAIAVLVLVIQGASLFASRAAAAEPKPAGELLRGDGKPRIFAVRRGSGDKIVEGFDGGARDKLRLAGFGLTDFDGARHLLRQVGRDALIELPGGQSLWIRGTQAGDLTADNFQLELDRSDLIETFRDDFKEFNWYAEGAAGDRSRRGTWRTNFGYAGPQDLGSRTLGSNGELQVYVDRGFRGTGTKPLGLEPFRVTDGVLQIIGMPTADDIKPFIWNYQYVSGLITTQLSFSQRYGVFEIRARLPKGRGLWPCAWLLPTDRSWPPEVDILEVLGQDPTILHTNVHSKANGNHTDTPTVITVPDTSADFHTYAVDWQKDQIRWFFDGVEVARAPTPVDMHKPMYMLANLAIGGHWPGPPDQATGFPAILAIDWIRVYQHRSDQ